MKNYEEVLVKILHRNIEQELNRLGLLFRVFSRAKTSLSIDEKIKLKGEGHYSQAGKKIQDLYGIRIALYFPDDLKIAQKAIAKLYTFISQEVDVTNITQFEATRCNFIFKLPQEIVNDSQVLRSNKLVDETFEVQFRTILSEGWHEVEHDLRYKCKSDWNNHNDLSRALNGIFASLETSEWGMMRLFEDLAYRHYKSREWAPMLRNKFRLRTGNELTQALEDIINKDDIGKKLYRLNRVKLILKILNGNINIPININSLVYIANYYFIKDSRISDIMPYPIKRILDELEI
ncbi:hypothetical protein CZ809_00782 [Photobacterium piscicola]|uniref:RelA/SpoT domain-containing protein n=1 Tax=Photobacterium piscicola TaxID=1378299 RepID=A0A1T5HWW2_9GAMM|nr:RelA/SpoT family protein [Photobacterium piscicola]MEC6899883.1 hypothetical protein [Photobacterium piscicola]SKC31304.1 hypothetical protein CZ809_00782 [Photobacterium piscicola]